LNKVALNSHKIIEIYNLAGQSHVKLSFDMPLYTAQTCALGTLNLLEAARSLLSTRTIKFYQASTSELFGDVHSKDEPQHELTPLNPASPYAASKLYAYHLVKLYRDSYKMFACNGILFNHESPRRDPLFVTRKICQGVANIVKCDGKGPMLELGYIDSMRDWCHAKDCVYGMWLMLQNTYADDFVLSSGETHSVREFCEKAFAVVGLELHWKGDGPEERGFIKNSEGIFIDVIKINPDLFRPTEVTFLWGSHAKARYELGWKPTVHFEELVREMVEAELSHLGI
jgi:GDPmannose 4,6-dehydratase